MLCYLAFTFLCVVVQTAHSIGQIPIISFESTPGSLQLTRPKSSVQIYINSREWPGVIRAARDLAADFGRVTGVNGTIKFTNQRNSSNLRTFSDDWSSTAQHNGGSIIIGTIGRTFSNDTVCGTHGKATAAIAGKWETYCTGITYHSSVDGRTLMIAGSDRRGTIYGIYDVSEQIGVSPWYWFADVAPRRRELIYALDVERIEGPPSIKYRGIFINDEAPALSGWIEKKYKGVFGADFYAHVFELLLRMRANYLWPAMWGKMFAVDDPRNQALADEYGVVMGTSHTEPMMRSTQEQNIYVKGAWQWNVNSQNIHNFMREGAQRAKPYESIFTIGMRGNHDAALNGGNAVTQLSEIFKAEREILDDVFGDARNVPQIWVLYTEVLSLYDDDGLQVPDDVTLMFPDDNFGNIRRLPIGNETNRSGGAGVYYHFDYVGSPRSYKWINTVQYQRTWEQMKLAYERHARRVWITNVGDIKGLEIPTNHFLDMAWDIEKFKKPNSTMWWLNQWARREFGDQFSAEIANVAMDYSFLAGRRKFESLEMDTYNVVDFEESERVLGEWRALKSAAEDISKRLPAELKPSFFEMILHPVLAGGNMHDIFISSAINQLHAYQGRNSANLLAGKVMEKWRYDHELTRQYHELLEGKWDPIMNTPHFYNHYWQQVMRDISPPLQYVQLLDRSLSGDLGVAIQGSKASVPGDDQFHTGGPQLTFPLTTPFSTPRWFEVFAQGLKDISFSVESQPFVTFSQSNGSLNPTNNDTDPRIYISIDWKRVPSVSGTVRINIRPVQSDNYGYGTPLLLLPYEKREVPSSFSGFVEDDGFVSMEAEHYSRIVGASSSLSYFSIPHFGKTLSGVSLTNTTISSLVPETAPHLEYDFFTFTNMTSNEPAGVSVTLAPALNIDPKNPLRYAISVDDIEPEVVQFVREKPKETRSGSWPNAMPHEWNRAVTEVSWISQTKLGIAAGKHSLKFWALDSNVVLTKVVINLATEKISYLGPPESPRV